MKRKVLFLIAAFLLAVICSGCGNSVKTEGELKKDLTAHSGFFMVDGSEVSELSIIKRLTDEDNKTDTVYVSILIDHPNATENRAYVMNYTLYNEGWILDDVEDYFGDEAVWNISPKGAPSNEQIMEELIAYSNSQIDLEYANYLTLPEELTHTYFFEDGKYATKIYSGSFPYPTEYSCTVETDRVFNYAKVYVKQQLYFSFNEFSYEWYLTYDEILSLDHGLDFYIDGTWQDPLSGATIWFYESSAWGSGQRFDGIPYSDFYAECSISGKKYTDEFVMLCPTTQRIDTALTTLGDVVFAPINVSIWISPDQLWCYDWFTEQIYELVPIKLDSYPSKLEVTGIIDMTGNS